MESSPESGERAQMAVNADVFEENGTYQGTGLLSGNEQDLVTCSNDSSNLKHLESQD